MLTVKQIKEKRSLINDQMADLNKLAKDEKRSFTEDEQTTWDGYQTEYDQLSKDLKTAEEREAVEEREARRKIAQTQQKNEIKDFQAYSFVKAIRSQANLGYKMDGIEKEMHQEGLAEAKRNGVKITGNVVIPGIILNPEKRVQDVTGQTTNVGDQGGVLVPTVKRGFIDILRERQVLMQMGATVLTGLEGDVSIPRKTQAGSFAWKAENAAADESQILMDDILLQPHRIAGYYPISKQLILQSSIDVEAMVRDDIIQGVNVAIQRAAINGSGTGAEPLGILNDPDISLLDNGVDGGAVTYENQVNLEAAIELENADVDTLYYLTNPNVKSTLKKTKLDAGSGLFVWDNNSSELNGYSTAITTAVPNDLDKGTSVGVCSAEIFGNFKDLLIAQWGGLDILVDPYTLAGSNQIKMVTNSLWDIALRHPESFAAYVDLLTT